MYLFGTNIILGFSLWFYFLYPVAFHFTMNRTQKKLKKIDKLLVLVYNSNNDSDEHSSIIPNKEVEMARKTIILSVEKAFRIIDLFRESPELSLSNIASMLDMPKTTAYGLISTLEKYEYLEQNIVSGKYRLGIALLELGEICGSRYDHKNEVVQELKLLCDQYNGNGHITKLIKDKVVYIENIEPKNEVIIRTRIGSRAPANCTSTGKAFLSCLSEERIDMLFQQKQLPILTPNSIDNIDDLKEHLKKIKIVGYSVDNEESILNVKGVGVVLKNRHCKPIYGVSIAALSNQMTDDIIRRIGEELKETVERLSERII